MPGVVVSYRDLIAWQKAMDRVDVVDRLTDRFPESERFGLAQQMRKAAVSIPSNIAEGTRHRRAGYISRLVIALGEHAELERQALIAARRGYVHEADLADFNGISRQVGELRHALLRALEWLNDPQR